MIVTLSLRATCIGTALIATLIITGCGNAVATEEVGVGSVTSVVINEQVRAGDPNADEGKTRGRSHFPKHPELYLPIPFPEPRDAKPVPPSKNRVVSHNMITGQDIIHKSQTKKLNLLTAAMAKSGFGGRAKLAGEEDGGQMQLLDFTELARVSDPEQYPWCVNVKLFMIFPGGVYSQASGILIDPLHVITAGHCILDPYDGLWADTIVVVPAYENGVRPYGDALAVDLYSWDAWIVDRNPNHDIGLIELDRPIGSITGWHGYGYNNDGTFFTNSTFFNPGYPAAWPHSGEVMYSWYGRYDSYEEYEVRVNKRAFGGQSGSGANHLDGDSVRRVYALLSHGTSWPPIYTDSIRITETKYGDIQSYIGGHTPSSVDLLPLDVKVSTVNIPAGNQLSSMSFLLHNYSSATWNDTVNFGVYLSTNDNIAPSDTLLQTHSVSLSLDGKTSSLIEVTPPPTIPPETAEGNYWIGVILNVSDYNTENNESDGQDASPLYINPGADHFAWDPVASPKRVEGPFDVTITAKQPNGSTATWFNGVVDITGRIGSDEVAVGSGTGGWDYPFHTFYHDARTQVIYLASEIDTPGMISSLSLDVSYTPILGLIMNNWTIRMKHTALSSYTSGSWESAGWTTVYQNNQNISSTGWVKFVFSTMFNYNGSDNLMIDFSFNNSSFSSSGECKYSNQAVNRSVYHATDSGYGDPLTWTGTTPNPYMSTKVPNIKLEIGEKVDVIPITSGAFVDGIWSGTAKALQTAKDMFLMADDGSGHSGLSNLFNVKEIKVSNVVINDSGIPILYIKSDDDALVDLYASDDFDTWTLIASDISVNSTSETEQMDTAGQNKKMRFYRLLFKDAE